MLDFCHNPKRGANRGATKNRYQNRIADLTIGIYTAIVCPASYLEPAMSHRYHDLIDAIQFGSLPFGVTTPVGALIRNAGRSRGQGLHEDAFQALSVARAIYVAASAAYAGRRR